MNGGHYPGLDSGACGNYLQEADVTKNLMQKVAGYLRNVGYEVLEVQENELEDITNTSNDFGADLFVSLHCNAATNTEAKGTEVFCYSLDGNGARLAQNIQDQIINSLGTVDRGIKGNKGLYVLKHTDCTACLVETAFISNEDDENLLANNLDDFAKAIARGITDYV
jgi:N-acetylmuramoyl-L-alanine amidase